MSNRAPLPPASPPYAARQTRSRRTALILELLLGLLGLPGIGWIYAGNVTKGVIFLFASFAYHALVTAPAGILSGGPGCCLFPLGYIILIISVISLNSYMKQQV